MTASRPRRSPFAPIVPALAVGLLAFLWLDHINPPFFITDDGVRDQLLARDCTDLGRCHRIGANASLPGFHHGPVWLDLLVAVRLLGGDTTTERTIVIALMALSVATLFVVVWRWLRPSLAGPASMLYAATLGADTYPSLLVNPSITALPDLLTCAGLLCFGLSGRRRYLLMAALALGAGISVHIGAMSLAVGLIVVVALVQARPWRLMIAALTVVGVTYGLTSSAALRANSLALAQPGRALPAAIAAALVVVFAQQMGASFRRWQWETRACVVGLVVLLPFAAMALWLIVREQHHFSIMYLHPILAPAAVLGAALLTLPFELWARRAHSYISPATAGETGSGWFASVRWIPTLVCVVVASCVAANLSRAAAPTPPAGEAWTPAEATAIAASAAQHDWSYDDLVFRVQSRACRDLLNGMAMALPAPHARPHRGNHQLQVVKAARSALPALSASDAVVDLDAAAVAIVRKVDSWLQPESLTACRAPLSGGPPRCAPALPRAIDALGPDRYLFIMRAFPDIHSLDLPRPYTASYSIPLAPGAGERRDVVLLDGGSDDCGWRFTRADNVVIDGTLPARRVRLSSSAGGMGSLRIERVFGDVGCSAAGTDMRYPPCLFELAPDDPLQAMVEPG